MLARSRAAIRTASRRSFNYLSTFINGGAARAEGGDEDQATDDRHVLQEVVHVVAVLGGVDCPEAVRGERGDEREQCDQPGGPAGLPAEDQQQSAADLDDDRKNGDELGRGKTELGEVSDRAGEAHHLAHAGDEIDRGNQDSACEQDKWMVGIVHEPSLCAADYAGISCASISTKAIRQGWSPRFTQAGLVPCCTSTSPASMCTSESSRSMSIAPSMTMA